MVIIIIGLIASIVTIIACWGWVSNLLFNYRTFKDGGWRITYVSNEYRIFKGDLPNMKLVFTSSTKGKDYVLYRGEGMYEHMEEIKPFHKWKILHWGSNICTPKYPLHYL